MFSPDTLTALKAQAAEFEQTARNWAGKAEQARKETAHCEQRSAMYGTRAAEFRALLTFAESHSQPLPQWQPVEGDVLVAGTPAPLAPEPWCRCGDDTRPGDHAFSACRPLDQDHRPRVRGPFEAATPQAPDTPETIR